MNNGELVIRGEKVASFSQHVRLTVHSSVKYPIEILQGLAVGLVGLSEDSGHGCVREKASEGVVIYFRDGHGPRWCSPTQWTRWRRTACGHGRDACHPWNQLAGAIALNPRASVS